MPETTTEDLVAILDRWIAECIKMPGPAKVLAWHAKCARDEIVALRTQVSGINRAEQGIRAEALEEAAARLERHAVGELRPISAELREVPYAAMGLVAEWLLALKEREPKEREPRLTPMDIQGLRANARAEALEEAATVADNACLGSSCRAIHAIRALKEKTDAA